MIFCNKKGETVGVGYKGTITQGVQEGSSYTVVGFKSRPTYNGGVKDQVQVNTPRGFRLYDLKTCGLKVKE